MEPSEFRKSVVFCPRSESLRRIVGKDDLGLPILKELTPEELAQLQTPNHEDQVNHEREKE